jgi:hypothetical protein
MLKFIIVVVIAVFMYKFFGTGATETFIAICVVGAVLDFAIKLERE